MDLVGAVGATVSPESDVFVCFVVDVVDVVVDVGVGADVSLADDFVVVSSSPEVVVSVPVELS